MNNLEHRLEELRAEMALCKLTMKMQKAIKHVEDTEESTTSIKALHSLFINAKKTFNFRTPDRGSLPVSWRLWVQEWNIFCIKHNRDRYMLYVHDNY